MHSRQPYLQFLPVALESRTSQVCSQIRYIRILRDFPVETSEFEVSSTENSLTALLTQWCLHGVNKTGPERRTSYLCCLSGGDRRDSNPRPPEPQSDERCCHV